MLIVANWKMNGDTNFAKKWCEKLLPSEKSIVVCPSFPLLSMTKEHLRGKAFLGAQDCHFFDKGAFTGFTSPSLLKELGCEFVILGHSERRYVESDQDINEKAKAAQKNGLTPIICVGESLIIRDKKNHLNFIKNQLNVTLEGLDTHYIIAYEPLWAIGTGRTALNESIEEMHAMIFSTLREMHHFVEPKILYGGSVTLNNISSICALKNVHGVLVGGASLDIDVFNEMIFAK